MQHYTFHPTVVVRNPLLPFRPESLTETHIRALVHEDWFLEAIYLASPELYRTAVAWRDGATLEKRKEEKLWASLTKYYSRMMSRCTPFGLFASCAALEWGEASIIAFEETKRHTRLDMHFLCALALALSRHPNIRKQLRYFTNDSLYTIGDELRYVEYIYSEGKRVHQLSAVEGSEPVRRVLEAARSGTDYRDLVRLLCSDDISKEEAGDFVDELIAAQLLVSDLEPALTGEPFIEQMVQVLQRVFVQTQSSEAAIIIRQLEQIRQSVDTFDSSTSNTIEDYRRLIAMIKALKVPVEENKLFQTDLFRQLPQGQLPMEAQQDIRAALEVLNRLSTKRKANHLTAFVQRFTARYETREVPLLEALDTETGIGYLPDQGTPLLPLVEDIVRSGNEQKTSMEWDKVQDWLFQQLKTATEQGRYTVALDADQLADLPEADWEDLPPSLAVLFRWAEDEQGQKRIVIDHAGGASAVNLLGRFAYGDKRIFDTVTDIATTEQAQNPDCVFAEILHLPESRTGNILLHPAFRACEIPFLGKSSLPLDRQISVQDLYVSIRQGQVILRSQRLDKIVVPRLSNAHNYSHNALPVYQFLCDLQHQNKRTRFGFDWGNMAGKYSFLPRVTYKNTILHAATWRLQKDQIKALLADTPVVGLPAFQDRLVTLADGDNELIIDWKNPLSVQAFKDAVKNREEIQLKEFLYEHTQPTFQDSVTRTGFVHQCIGLLVRQAPAHAPAVFERPVTSLSRRFSIGSEWLYFKLYGGVKAADKVLVNYLKPLCDELQQRKWVDKWFFIRYSDPDPHVRVRFHLTDSSQIGDVIQLFYRFLQPALEARYLWKIQVDTYERELERYGFEAIAQAEELFYHDSEAVLAFLDQTEGDAREELRWLWGMRAIDVLLDSFQMDTQQKLDLLTSLRESFAKEFNLDIALKQQLDKKYRLHRASLQHLLTKDPSVECDPLSIILTTKSANILPVALQLSAAYAPSKITYWMSSYIHMLVNRLIPSEQRLHELVMYDFLCRYYQSSKYLEVAL
ncbi:lantibiotic dehydratase [Runella slithyformis]|uniref:Lantibiotic dehydratase domain protein n=1 Tax=Runella slithyformis (strain ATCC 29530 / DSM 19594 / LMG 11500 / NCIMB 11436 / LSU 4) TaxID=761193 RepID=A0A7U3ZKG8_RUNSL|nr:lantibiotic dehydratase [Runella slithyformis]AEI48871.1 Lantibiotic dehydratase domain protein [Runella slithyformis DSM 19594]